MAARLAAAGSTALVLALRQAAACGVVAGSMAVHECTGSWLAASLRAPGPTAGLSTAAGSTAGGLAAGGHTCRLEAGGPAAGGLTAGRATARLAAAGPIAGGLTAGGHTSRSAADGPATGSLTASWGAAGLTAGGLAAGGPAIGGPAAGRLTARGAAGMGHGVRCGGVASKQRQISQNLNTSSLLDLLYSGSPI